MKRQALYACATCTREDMEPAGVCLACSLECHEGHTLYELYTKRYIIQFTSPTCISVVSAIRLLKPLYCPERSVLFCYLTLMN